MEVALTVPTGNVADGKIGLRTTEGRLYATARALVTPSEYAVPWNSLGGDWLPGSGYQPDQSQAMEFYRNDPDTDPEGKYLLEICLPIRPL